jgi:hypothetical protein
MILLREMAIVFDQPQRVADWVAAQSGDEAPTVDAAIGYENEGELKAGVYFDGLSGSNIFCHIASTTEMLPVDLMRASFAYVFEQLKLRRASFAFNASNKKVCALLQGMGSQHEATLRDVYDDDDMVIYVLRNTDPFSKHLLNPRRH